MAVSIFVRRLALLLGLAIAFHVSGFVSGFLQAQTYSPNGCSSYIPGPGDTIVCNNTFPSSTSGVQTPQSNTGNNNVTVNI